MQKTKNQTTKSPTTIYTRQVGAHFTNDDAQIIGRELEKLGNFITAQDVVEKASNPNSPLHKFFHWDNQRAAKLHRLSQARRLLSFIRVVVTTGDKPTPVKQFYNVSGLAQVETGKNSHGLYANIKVVQDSKQIQEHILKKGKAALRRFQNNFSVHREYFAGIFDEIERLHKEEKV